MAKKVRLTLELNGRAAEALEALADETGKSKADLLREGFALRRIVEEAEAEDGHLEIVTPTANKRIVLS